MDEDAGTCFAGKNIAVRLFVGVDILCKCNLLHKLRRFLQLRLLIRHPTSLREPWLTPSPQGKANAAAPISVRLFCVLGRLSRIRTTDGRPYGYVQILLLVRSRFVCRGLRGVEDVAPYGFAVVRLCVADADDRWSPPTFLKGFEKGCGEKLSQKFFPAFSLILQSLTPPRRRGRGHRRSR